MIVTLLSVFCTMTAIYFCCLATFFATACFIHFLTAIYCSVAHDNYYDHHHDDDVSDKTHTSVAFAG